MSRLAMLGAETGHIHAEGITNFLGTPTFDTAIKRSGARSFRYDATATPVTTTHALAMTGVTEVTYTVGFSLYVPSATGHPVGADVVVARFLNGSTALGAIRLNRTGQLVLVRTTATVIGSPSAVLSLDTWHRIDLKQKIGVGTVDEFEARLGGVVFATSGVITHGDLVPTTLRFGLVTTPSANFVIYIDDIIVQDSTGAAHTGYPGDEKVLLLLPTADSSRDAGWTGGLVAAPGTTNLFDAVNDVPPNGVAAGSATNATQIRNAVSTTTEQYSATMQTYTAAGVGASDTVTAVQGLMVLASAPNSTTSSGVQATSNPAIAESLVTLTNVVMATYPTGWVRGVTAMAENPAVTKGTAPVVRVRKNAASTTAHNVGLLGLLISYVPAGAPTTQRRRLLMMLAAMLSLWRTLWPAPSR